MKKDITQSRGKRGRTGITVEEYHESFKKKTIEKEDE